MIPCTLVHDTGTMIRFRTSQLGDLPDESVDLQIVLPTGRLVDGHFNRHPQNPNVSGIGIVRFIKRRMGFGEREPVLIDWHVPGRWVLHTLQDAEPIVREAHVPLRRVREGALVGTDLTRLLALADRHAEAGLRIEAYRRLLRPSGLRRLVLELMGTQCQAKGCTACETFDRDWGNGAGKAIVDVHHIESVARINDHHPRNLCVLCANHHRFVHGWGSWTVTHVGPDITLTMARRNLLIQRPAGLFAT